MALSFRTGVNTGEVVAGEGETLVTGDAVNVAARLEQAAPTGEILIGAGTLSLVRDAVKVEAVEPLELKGKRQPVAAFRLVAVDATADAFTRHLDAPLVGRTREQQRLQAALEDVASDEAMTAAETMLAEAAGVGERSDAERVIGKLLAIRGEIEAARDSVRRSVEGNREAGKRSRRRPRHRPSRSSRFGRATTRPPSRRSGTGSPS